MAPCAPGPRALVDPGRDQCLARHVGRGTALRRHAARHRRGAARALRAGPCDGAARAARRGRGHRGLVLPRGQGRGGHRARSRANRGAADARRRRPVHPLQSWRKRCGHGGAPHGSEARRRRDRCGGLARGAGHVAAAHRGGRRTRAGGAGPARGESGHRDHDQVRRRGAAGAHTRGDRRRGRLRVRRGGGGTGAGGGGGLDARSARRRRPERRSDGRRIGQRRRSPGRGG